MLRSNDETGSHVILDSGAREEAATIKIQSFVRCRIARKHLANLKKTKKLDSLRLLKAARERRNKLHTAAIAIQSMVRAALQRQKYQSAKAGSKRVSGMHYEIELLKERLAQSKQEREKIVQEAEARVAEALKKAHDAEQKRVVDQAEVEQISMRARLDEFEKVVDFLRKERQRLVALAKMHKGRCERIIEQDQKPLQESIREVRSSMGEVEEYVSHLETSNDILNQNKRAFENQIATYHKEIQKAQAYKQNEEEIGKIYQNAVERIVNLVQKESDQDDMVEDLYIMAMESGDIFLEGGDEGMHMDDSDDLVDLDFRGALETR